ncbi:imelysin family protein [Paracoccus pacificus]|uniref:Imelysin family protein n=1 Tax=Paracoccus pacificus TaxID=1463598 RepID=A0ABW4RBV6_9RHOB
MSRRIALIVCTALTPLPALAAPTTAEVIDTYADIAEAGYSDSLSTARDLQTAVQRLTADPSEENLNAAREAWKAARVPYQQTEVFRFGNPIVDDWEGAINSWPLDEGLIDYVADGFGTNEENALAGLNVIANPTITIGGKQIDATVITPELISGTLHEADGNEANVASGYHAIEFLLWGQDLNGTGPGAGERPWTDYAKGDACTGGNCDRRAAYLQAATELLVRDMAYMAEQWGPDGAARKTLTDDPDAGIRAMLTGMGSLSYGEQAGERMKLGLMLNDPEEEHDCFSDNTPNSHYYDGLGVDNVYLGRYKRVDGTEVAGPSLSELVAAADPAIDSQLKAELADSLTKLDALRKAQAAGMAYDQMLAPGNDEGERLIMAAVDALVAQTRSIERAASALNVDQVTIEGSDSLDQPEAVFQ